MVGPSSNHTGGACRIGIVARSVLGAEPASLTMGFYSVTVAKNYRGHATDRAIVHGLLGGSVDDVRMRDALKTAKSRGLKVDMEPIPAPVPDNNIMRCDITDVDGNRVVVTGYSVGGGSIVIPDVDGFPMNLDGSGHVVLFEYERKAWAKAAEVVHLVLGPNTPIQTAGRTGTIPGTHPRVPRQSEDTMMAVVKLNNAPGTRAIDAIRDVPGIVRVRYVPPVRKFFKTNPDVEPITFAWISENSKEPAHERIIRREMLRDGATHDEIVREMAHVFEVMREAKDIGVTGEVDMLCGLDDGRGGRRLLDYEKSRKPLTGSALVRSVAYAIAVNSVNASMGRIVACPTGGASGTLPGTLLGALEAGNLPVETGVNALFVAAAAGAAIGRLCSFSGSVGGCLGEIGFAAAMGAAALAYLETQDGEAASHAAALALKAVMGLVCDPPAGPVEIPCVKRNGALVGVAFSCGEMAAAGIRSSIPPDEVVLATKNVQDLMPQSIKGNMEASLGCTPTARLMKARWAEVLAREESEPVGSKPPGKH